MTAEPTDPPSTWVDLVPVAAGDHVRLPPELAPAAPTFIDRGAHAHAGRPTDEGPADIVVAVDGRQLPIESLLAGIAPGGRLVVLGRSRWSPLRRRSAGGGDRVASLSAVRRILESDDRVAAVHALGLFPSLLAPTSAYRLDLPAIGEIVLTAAATGAPRLRRRLLWLFGRVLGWSAASHLPPAWMVVAHVGALPAAAVPTGRIGVAANEQGVVLIGRGPDAIEKDYGGVAAADRVATLHQELVDAGVEVVQPVRSRPSPTRLRFDWVPGRVVDASTLDDDDLARWSGRAAEILGGIHGATARDDGTVIAHGDFWLGALVADGERVTVIDWTDGCRADPLVDVEVLTTLIRQRATLPPEERHRILDEMARRYETAGGPTGVFGAAGTLMQ